MSIQTWLLFSLLLTLAPTPSPADTLYNLTSLGNLGVSAFQATAMNDAGQVTGYSEAFPTRAFLYSDGQMIELGTLGGNLSQAYAVNNSGQVTGISWTATGSSHAFLYTDGKMTDLDTLG